MKSETFLPHKKELTIPNQQQKSKFFWLSLICLWSIWSLSKLNTNRYGNCFDQFHFELQPKREKNIQPSKFLHFCGRVRKVFWNMSWLCRKWFCLLSTFILRFVFQKQQWVDASFFLLLVDKFRCKCDRHEKFHCDKKVKPFCFLQKYCF